MNEGRLRGKLNSDLVWSIAGLALFAVAGFGLNSLIGRYYGAAILGYFNLVLALYLILAQVCVGGMYFSVLRFASECAEDAETLGQILVSALAVAMAASLATCGALFVLRHPISAFFDSPDMALGLLCILPGLVAFACNKVFAALVNGMRHMRFLALTNAARGGLIVAAAWAIYRAGLTPALLPLALTAAELGVLALFAVFAYGRAGVPFSRLSRVWLERQLRFARGAFLSGFLLDINPRVDLLMLGYFMGDRAVGIYSMAAMIAEGVYQLPVVVQLNVNPLIARFAKAGAWGQLQQLARRTHLLLVPAMVCVTAALVLVYGQLMSLLTDDPVFVSGQTSCAILVSAIALASGYIAFSMALSQCGYPGCYTVFLGFQIGTNIALNTALIPSYGIEGAAVASGAATLLSALYLRLMVRRTLGVGI